jgi:hypothetical protein
MILGPIIKPLFGHGRTAVFFVPAAVRRFSRVEMIDRQW